MHSITFGARKTPSPNTNPEFAELYQSKYSLINFGPLNLKFIIFFCQIGYWKYEPHKRPNIHRVTYKIDSGNNSLLFNIDPNKIETEEELMYDLVGDINDQLNNSLLITNIDPNKIETKEELMYDLVKDY